jgi:hypothetical protein
MLDALVNWKDRHVAGAGQPAVSVELLQAPQDLGIAVGLAPEFSHAIGARYVEPLFVDGLAGVLKESTGLAAQQFGDSID